MIDQLPAMAGGGVLSTVILAALAWFTRKSWHAAQRQDVAAADAGTDIIQALREEVRRLGDRVKVCEEELQHERRHGRLLEEYVWTLQSLMRTAGVEVPVMPRLER